MCKILAAGLFGKECCQVNTFREIVIEDAIEAIREADSEKAFLPSVSDPGFSVEKFLVQGEILGYRLFGTFDVRNILVGFASINQKDVSIVSIGPMYIVKTSRGKGLGRWQVEKVIDWAIANGIRSLTTRTWGENIASRKIFEDLGFKLVEEKLNARINGDSTLKYHLDLTL